MRLKDLRAQVNLRAYIFVVDRPESMKTKDSFITITLLAQFKTETELKYKEKQNWY